MEGGKVKADVDRGRWWIKGGQAPGCRIRHVMNKRRVRKRRTNESKRACA